MESRTIALNDVEKTHPNLSSACNRFSSRFHKVLSTLSKDVNVVSSPLSAHILLSLLTHGAKGATLIEMKNGLNFDDALPSQDEFKSLMKALNNVEGVELRVANALYIQKGFELSSNFLTLSKEAFDCTVSRVDYQKREITAQTINDWVKKSTKDKITDIVHPRDFTRETVLFLINAIYFKGNWAKSFDKKQTRDQKFYVTKSIIDPVPTMFKQSVYLYGELKVWDARFLQIPYVNTDFAMMIILPNEIEGLRSLEEKFSWDTLKTMATNRRDVKLYLPKFKIEATIALVQALKELGIRTMFADEADFADLADFPLKVNSVVQKIYIKVDEEGCEAAAVTAVARRSYSLLPQMFASSPLVFRVDHPFMIAIHHKPSDVPLFIGSVKHIPTSDTM